MGKKKTPKIKNSQRVALRRWIFVDVFFIILGFRSYLTFDMNSFDGMFILVSITIVITSLFFIRSTLKNIKALDNAINNNIMIAHFRYTKKEWTRYLNYEEKYRLENGKAIAIILSVITSVVFIPFILIIPDGKVVMFFVLLGLYVMYAFMGLLLPKILFYFRQNKGGEVILLKKGILLNKQFHTWDFALSKFNSAKHMLKPYNHLSITYDFIDRTGPRSYTVNVPIPENNRKDIDVIISQFE